MVELMIVELIVMMVIVMLSVYAACTLDDAAYIFTPCDGDGTRTLVYYWPPNKNCSIDDANDVLPLPVAGLPCSMNFAPQSSYFDIHH